MIPLRQDGYGGQVPRGAHAFDRNFPGKWRSAAVIETFTAMWEGLAPLEEMARVFGFRRPKSVLTRAARLGLPSRRPRRPSPFASPEIQARRIEELWRAGASVAAIVRECNFGSATAVYKWVKKLGLPLRQPRAADDSPRACLRKCLRHGGDFWSPDKRLVQICPACKTLNTQVYDALADAGAIGFNGAGAGW